MNDPGIPFGNIGTGIQGPWQLLMRASSKDDEAPGVHGSGRKHRLARGICADFNLLQDFDLSPRYVKLEPAKLAMVIIIEGVEKRTDEEDKVAAEGPVMKVNNLGRAAKPQTRV